MQCTNGGKMWRTLQHLKCKLWTLVLPFSISGHGIQLIHGNVTWVRHFRDVEHFAEHTAANQRVNLIQGHDWKLRRASRPEVVRMRERERFVTTSTRYGGQRAQRAGKAVQSTHARTGKL
jgi:hypothetical protein